MDAATITEPIAVGEGPAAAAAPPDVAAAPTMTPAQMVLTVLGVIAFLYFARPVVLPVVLAVVAGMALKPLIRWLSCCHIAPAISAGVVIVLLVAALGTGFFHLGRPAVKWLNEAPQHLAELRVRALRIFPSMTRFNEAAAAMDNLGAADNEREKPTVVEIKSSHVPGGLINWTGTLLAGREVEAP